MTKSFWDVGLCSHSLTKLFYHMMLNSIFLFFFGGGWKAVTYHFFICWIRIANNEVYIMKFLILNGCIHFENEMGRENIWKMIVRSFCNVANFVSIDARVWFLVLETYNVQQHYCFHSKKSFSKFVWHGSFSLGAQER